MASHAWETLLWRPSDPRAGRSAVTSRCCWTQKKSCEDISLCSLDKDTHGGEESRDGREHVADLLLCVTLTKKLKGGCSVTYLCALNGNSTDFTHGSLFTGLKQYEGIWEKLVFPALLQRFWSSSSYVVQFSLFFKVISYTKTSDSCLDNPESGALTIIFTIKWSGDCFLNYLMNYLHQGTVRNVHHSNIQEPNVTSLGVKNINISSDMKQKSRRPSHPLRTCLKIHHFSLEKRLKRHVFYPSGCRLIDYSFQLFDNWWRSFCACSPADFFYCCITR